MLRMSSFSLCFLEMKTVLSNSCIKFVHALKAALSLSDLLRLMYFPFSIQLYEVLYSYNYIQYIGIAFKSLYYVDLLAVTASGHCTTEMRTQTSIVCMYTNVCLHMLVYM